MRFFAHTDDGGVGSSLYSGHAYEKCGTIDCKQDFSEQYDVLTVDFAAYMKRVARPKDVIVMRMDIEGAEYEVARHMVVQGVACWVDLWEFEAHAMYTNDTRKFRPVDAVLPWLLRACGVQMVVQDWYTEDFKVFRTWGDSDPCSRCRMPVIEG
mmetsp:Transcript_64316/g.172145  ORF Transcript_64316/g.172145 Transcript_64316/m.172145 type:complete len:154 (+) Transcript_64316:188-649(+)